MTITQRIEYLRMIYNDCKAKGFAAKFSPHGVLVLSVPEDEQENNFTLGLGASEESQSSQPRSEEAQETGSPAAPAA